MINLEKLVETTFTISKATDITNFFRNIGYLTVGTDSVQTGYVLPEDKVVIINNDDTLNAVLKPDSQEYMDISKIIAQKGNMNPNKSRVNNVVVYFAEKQDSENYANLINEFISVNANWAQLLINSNNDEDIEKAAEVVLTRNRLFVAQCNSDNVANKEEGNIASKLKAKNNANVYLTYHTTPNESLAAGIASIMAQPNLGGVGSLYSTITDITPEDYTSTINQNLDDQNVTYYSYINAINGGGVSQYAQPIVYGAYMINGEDAKRRYIRFCLDLLLKQKSIDFLKKQLGYEDVSADVLLSMLKSVLKAAQLNGLVKLDSIIRQGEETIETKGFEVWAVYPSALRESDETLYNSQTYRIRGYYRDSLTGRKVEINMLIDPSQEELNIFQQAA